MGSGLTQGLREVLALALLAASAATLAACGGPSSAVGTAASQFAAPVSAGDYLYCITNVGHTLTVYDLARRQVRPQASRYLDLDPVGPWFSGGAGYYLSRVDTSGAGANALIRFDPVTGAETGRLRFPADSNPNSLLVLPSHPGVAWVALRGSTFDNFATDGISVVDLTTLRDTAFCDLNAATGTSTCPALHPAGAGTLTSPLGFQWDAAGCGGAGCAYAVVNDFDNSGVRNGWLLALQPDSSGVPTLNQGVPLGRNPMQDVVLDTTRSALWVVNNGGYVHYDANGQAGTLQVLDTTNLAADPDSDGLAGTTLAIESAATCGSPPSPDPGCDPTGIYTLDGSTGWLTTYPNDVLRTVDLSTQALGTSPVQVTGPFFPVADDPANPGNPALFAALGGLGLARLGELNAIATTLLRDDPLDAGPAPLSCTEYTVP
ncbi:MAG TPA: hypothetical protein VKB51_19305 [bacterium]|nr:hypothetical protein [bacterium]